MLEPNAVCPLCGYSNPRDFSAYAPGWECCFGCDRVYDYNNPERDAYPMVAYRFESDDHWVVEFFPDEGDSHRKRL